MCDAGLTDAWASIAWMLLLLVDAIFGSALNINSKPAWWSGSAWRGRVFSRSPTASARFAAGSGEAAGT